ncbi:MAG: xanthine dehydrogenase accessory protein XdhC [Betaproteobacteria bacterium]|nr:MAG: xanthine dehydrogenase accessory protein XdhC [Betaproteobacteria bacterium]
MVCDCRRHFEHWGSQRDAGADSARNPRGHFACSDATPRRSAVNQVSPALRGFIERDEPAVWLVVSDTKGSVPREAGTSMFVTARATLGTIGGGHLELNAIEHARTMLATQQTQNTQRHYPLGPALGQCCGGAMALLFMPVNESARALLPAIERAETFGETFELCAALDTGAICRVALAFSRWDIWIFGAGHVGKALIDVLATLPCELTWVDGRETEFPTVLPSNVRTILSDTPADEVAHIPKNAQVLVLTHSHAIDLEICFALLRRDDLAYCGLIGSSTKAATFRKRFEQRGIADADFARIICPIGDPSLNSKHPGVIAVSVALDLTRRQQQFHSVPIKI